MNSDSKQDFHVGDLIKWHEPTTSGKEYLGVVMPLPLHIIKAKSILNNIHLYVWVYWHGGSDCPELKKNISLLVKAQHSDEKPQI